MEFLKSIWVWVLVVITVVTLTVLLMLSKVENGKLQSNIEVLNSNIIAQQTIIANYNDQIKDVSTTNINLSKELSNNAKELSKQQSQFNSNNLERLLNLKPTLIIKQANRKTKEIFDDYSTFTQDFEDNK